MSSYEKSRLATLPKDVFNIVLQYLVVPWEKSDLSGVTPPYWWRIEEKMRKKMRYQNKIQRRGKYRAHADMKRCGLKPETYQRIWLSRLARTCRQLNIIVKNALCIMKFGPAIRVEISVKHARQHAKNEQNMVMNIRRYVSGWMSSYDLTTFYILYNGSNDFMFKFQLDTRRAYDPRTKYCWVTFPNMNIRGKPIRAFIKQIMIDHLSHWVNKDTRARPNRRLPFIKFARLNFIDDDMERGFITLKFTTR